MDGAFEVHEFNLKEKNNNKQTDKQTQASKQIMIMENIQDIWLKKIMQINKETK